MKFKAQAEKWERATSNNCYNIVEVTIEINGKVVVEGIIANVVRQWEGALEQFVLHTFDSRYTLRNFPQKMLGMLRQLV